jgi:DNA polymerase III alpha subunit
MIIDKFNNSIYQTKDIINALYTQNFDIIESLIVEPTKDVELFESNSGINLKKINEKLYNVDILEFDKICQEDWFMPEEYKNMDIEGYLVNVCPKENYQRLIEELQEYRERNLLPLLRILKYIVDTFRKNNIVWGVGRGSSVASYVLYLLGVHKINSVKYNLNWQEFLR